MEKARNMYDNYLYMSKSKKLTEGGEEGEGGGGNGENFPIIRPAAAASFFVACSLGN